MGTSAYLAIVGTVTITILLEAYEWNALFLALTSLSWLFLFPSLFFYDGVGFPTPNMIGVAGKMFETPYFFFWFFIPIACTLVTLTNYFIEKVFSPRESTKIVMKKNTVVPE